MTKRDVRMIQYDLPWYRLTADCQAVIKWQAGELRTDGILIASCDRRHVLVSVFPPRPPGDRAMLPLPAAALASIQLLRAERLVRLPDQQPKGPDWLRLSLTKKPLLRLGNGIVAQQTWTDESRARYRRERGR